MSATLDYPGGSLEFPFESERFVGVWSGPRGRSGEDVAGELRRALAHPLDFPPLRESVFPGDRVTLAVDPRVPELSAIVAVVVNVLEAAGVERSDIRVVATGPPGPGWDGAMPAGVAAAVHDPDAKEAMTYLATTAGERRIYLSREATEADFVLPIGLVGVDAKMGTGGPWSVIFPGLTDRATRDDLNRATGSTEAQRTSALDESSEVGWLLGNLFQIGVVPGITGIAEVFAGLHSSVRAKGIEAARSAWTFRVGHLADLAVVSVGPGAGLEATWSALATGAELVRRGGKVVALSDAGGAIGPAASRLAGAEGPGGALSTLRGAEHAPDYAAARRLAEALARADLYLFSRLDPDSVEDLGIVPLSRPEEARRLAGSSQEVALVGRAELISVAIEEDDA